MNIRTVLFKSHSDDNKANMGLCEIDKPVTNQEFFTQVGNVLKCIPHHSERDQSAYSLVEWMTMVKEPRFSEQDDFWVMPLDHANNDFIAFAQSGQCEGQLVTICVKVEQGGSWMYEPVLNIKLLDSPEWANQVAFTINQALEDGAYCKLKPLNLTPPSEEVIKAARLTSNQSLVKEVSKIVPELDLESIGHLKRRVASSSICQQSCDENYTAVLHNNANDQETFNENATIQLINGFTCSIALYPKLDPVANTHEKVAQGLKTFLTPLLTSGWKCEVHIKQ